MEGGDLRRRARASSKASTTRNHATSPAPSKRADSKVAGKGKEKVTLGVTAPAKASAVTEQSSGFLHSVSHGARVASAADAPFPVSSSSHSDVSTAFATASPVAAVSSLSPSHKAVEDVTRKRWHDWSVRWASGLAMIGAFLTYLLLTRQLGIVLLVFVMQTLIYSELVKIAINFSKEQQMPGFHLFYYYWFFVCAFFMYIKTLRDNLFGALSESLAHQVGAAAHFAVRELAAATVAAGNDDLDPSVMLDPSPNPTLQTDMGGVPDTLADMTETQQLLAVLPAIAARGITFVLRRYVLIAFALYFLGLMAFVLSLRRQRHFKYQFKQFAYCHVALLVAVVQSTFLVSNTFQGLIWFLLPVSLVIANDTFAYVFGFMYGRTPLIALSPKKTVEGFVGGAVATFFFSLFLTWLYSTADLFDIKYLMLCPADSSLGLRINHCNIEEAAGGIYKFHPLSHWFFSAYLPSFLHSLLISEMQLHALVLATFASIVAPFGGFFASGFKRALKIKDFGNSIPGHGGFTDRMDCQLVMGSFSYVYLSYALNVGTGFRGGLADVTRMFARIVAHMSATDVQLLNNMLTCYLGAETSLTPNLAQACVQQVRAQLTTA